MIQLRTKFLSQRELPARDPYPASHLVTFLEGTETINLIADTEAALALGTLEPLTDVLVELKMWRVDLKALGAPKGGSAYKLRVLRVVSP